MKKILFIIVVIFSLTFCSCSSLRASTNTKSNTKSDNTASLIPKSNSNSLSINNQINPKINITYYKIKDYYPFKENAKYLFNGKGNEYSSYSSWIDYIIGNRIQVRTNNGGTETVRVLENKDGELKIAFNKSELYYRENLTNKKSSSEEILLKEPLIKGTTWILPDGRKRLISNTDVKINTPLGNFNSLEVTTDGIGSDKTFDYYALNMGLIKSIYSTNGTEITSTLGKIVNNSPLVQEVKFYYPNINTNKLNFIYKNLTFNTNDLTKVAFGKIFNVSPNKVLNRLYGPDVKINSLYLNDNKVVYVDFSKNLVSQINAGSGFETMILQSITNTLGNYYGVNKVYITIENQPYSSGHIKMKKGEAFTVNTENSIEFKN